MPHVCVFSSQQDWLDFIVARWPDFDPDADSVSPPGDGATDDAAWGKDPDIEGALEGTATDQVRAMARVLHHLLSRIQPHVQGEVQAVLHRPENVFFSSDRNRGERRYVGMHVRETEGRKYAKFTVTETLDCFEKASKYLEDLDMFAGGYIRASEIVGICLVSEDDTALPEAKKIVRRYFRNVESENIVHVSAASAYSSLGSSGGISKEVSHATALAGALAEMQLMAKADVFVGVASGAFDRLVFLMRDILLLERRTSLSMERGHQFPGLPLPSRRGRGR